MSITSSAKTGNVTVTIRIMLPQNNGGTKITGSQVFVGGKSCTIQKLATSCTIKNVQAKKIVSVQAYSKNVKGFGAKSRSISYLVGSSYRSRPVVVSPKPTASTPATTPTASTPVTTFNVTNIGATSYQINGQTNPTLTVIRGVTYTFAVNVPGHPFWLQTKSGAFNSNNIFSSGVLRGGAEVGVITWKVPNEAPNTVFYVCSWHSSQNGQINVVNAR